MKANFNQSDVNNAIINFEHVGKVCQLPSTDASDVLDPREFEERWYVKHTLEKIVGRAARNTPKSNTRIGRSMAIPYYHY